MTGSKHYWMEVHYTDHSAPTQVVVCATNKTDAHQAAPGELPPERRPLVDHEATRIQRIHICPSHPPTTPTT